MTERQSMTSLGTVRGAGPAAREHTERPAPGWPTVILRVVGSGLLIATAAIHLDLYLTGYRAIPTIGWLFLLQVIAAFGLGLAVLAIPRRLAVALPATRLAAAAGAGFALATLGGYLLSVWIGLFGFKEVRTGAGTAAGLVDAALVLFGLVVAGASSPAPAATGTGTGLKTTTIGGATVLTNAQGFTLYWFAPDTPAVSKCYGSCAAYWLPVTGTAAASPGLPGRIGTITRTGGARQLTYNGHPLYTYIGDSTPGQAKGNNLNLNGGLWHEVPVS